ncbi:hypothetical protein L227DRAFT_572629 [Lentinus tigrinus ALCF2SS1-6]|uniref:Uncharacterized protein n=1 Tax=Lentinus tigrinus ALCF2SS1-6 TaxID=1328759 RepID=A0A5C2SI85_9APHY|nr:hypothetical protein L227DRAFT_572629 [Lentinus tigrinus ALCF2SS1-6]
MAYQELQKKINCKTHFQATGNWPRYRSDEGGVKQSISDTFSPRLVLLKVSVLAVISGAVSIVRGLLC